jgi:hypothetical protein
MSTRICRVPGHPLVDLSFVAREEHSLYNPKHNNCNMSRPGGLGNVRPADDDVNLVVASVKADLENKAGRTFTDVKPVSYATQVC